MLELPHKLTHLEVPNFSVQLFKQAPQNGSWSLNLENVKVIDSAFLALLLAILRYSKRKNLNLELHGLRDNAKSLLEVYGIFELLAKYLK